MIERILSKWKHNWRFLLAVTMLQVVVAIGYAWTRVEIGPFAPNHQPPEPVPLDTAVYLWAWPAFDVVDVLIEKGWLLDGLVTLLFALLGKAFLWATAVLELRQVLARTVLRNPRAGG